MPPNRTRPNARDTGESVIRIALVSCVKSKLETPAPAKELYTSALFRGMRTFAETHADAWYILSAQHGLLHPDQVIGPYERTLKKMSKGERNIWAIRVQTALVSVVPPQAEVLILAGIPYRKGVESFLRDLGCEVKVPMVGLNFGNQLKWLRGSRD